MTTRILERLDDSRALVEAVTRAAEDDPLLVRYFGTELVDCFAADCHRAVIASGPLDMDLTLELVDDEGWRYQDGMHLCPEHHEAGVFKQVVGSVVAHEAGCDGNHD